ncbi:MAG: hypothetical protein Q8876_07940 [Bacillota bacterium]|nr:hypothetical protein [Bacillota bacterium]
MDYGFFFEYDGTVLQLPVNPEKLTVQYNGKNTTIDVVSLGEVNIIKNYGLQTFTIDSFLPQRPYGNYIRTKNMFLKPEQYLKFWEKVKSDKRPMRLVVTGININLLVSIENSKKWVEGGDDDVYFTLELKEYRDYSPTTLVLTTSTSSSASSSTTATNSSKQATSARPKIVVGSKVIVNGVLHRDSYGSGAGATRKNYHGVISYINLKGSCPYHISTPSGGWQGWVTAGSVKLA